MPRICGPAVAGTFYPADAQSLQQQVSQLLQQAAGSAHPPFKALIAPHASYIYSGPIAGSAYANLQQRRESIERVVLLAPAHRVAFRGIASCSAAWFETPLGRIAVDREALQQIETLGQVVQIDMAFTQEHSIEVQLPFLQACLDRFTLVPLLVGDASPEVVSEVIERLWGGDETLIVISSDLSHYLEYSQAQQSDQRASEAILSLQPGQLSQGQACGRIPIAGLLLSARRHQLQPVLLDLRNSGDTAGPRDRVVGYGAYGFHV